MMDKRLHYFIIFSTVCFLYISRDMFDSSIRKLDAQAYTFPWLRNNGQAPSRSAVYETTTTEKTTTSEISPTTYSKNTNSTSVPFKTTQTNLNINIKEDGAFTPLDNEPHFYVRSAYLDNRFSPPKIQILVVMGWHLLSQPGQIRCHLVRSQPDGPEEESVAVELKKLSNPINCFFRSVVILCDAPREAPEYVSVSYKEQDPTFWMKPVPIKPIDEPDSDAKRLGVCVKTLFNLPQDYLPNIAVFIEMQRILKADQIIMYDAVNSSDVYKTLFKYYEDRGLLKIVPWKLNLTSASSEDYRRKVFYSPPKSAPKKTGGLSWCVFMHAQRLAIHDCLLNNMDKFQYLTYLDKDEYIIPRKGKDLSDVLTDLEETYQLKQINVFQFMEAHFCPDVQKHLDVTFGSLLRLQPIINTHVKSVISPKLVKEMACHHVIKSFAGTSETVASSIAAVHHYRDKSFCLDLSNTTAASYLKRNTDGLVLDETATKYFTELADRLRISLTDLDSSLPKSVVLKLKHTIAYLESSNSRQLQPQERKYLKSN